MNNNLDYSNIDLDQFRAIDQDELKQSEDLFKSQDMVKLIKTYLDEEAPLEMRENCIYKYMWGTLSKSIKLTFLTEKDFDYFESMFNQSKITYLMSIPANKYSFQDMLLFDQLKIIYLCAIKRSIGSSTHKFNERIILGGTINQTIRSNTETLKGVNNGGGGFFSKFSNMF
jgi:hypothetical protein